MTVFYKNFMFLCKKEGKLPTVLLKEIGMDAACNTRWKNGNNPRDDKLEIISEHFGLSPEEMMNVDLQERTGTTKKRSIKITEEELDLIGAWRKCNEKEKAVIETLLSSYGFEIKEKVDITAEVG